MNYRELLEELELMDDDLLDQEIYVEDCLNEDNDMIIHDITQDEKGRVKLLAK